MTNCNYDDFKQWSKPNDIHRNSKISFALDKKMCFCAKEFVNQPILVKRSFIWNDARNFLFSNCIMILWITDRRWNEIWLTVAFHHLDQWSSWNSCSVNPYVIFWKMARNEIIREIDFFHLKCCLSLEGSTFYDGNLYHRSKLYIELLFYLLIKKFAQ